MKPRVSIIVPVYNVEKYLPQCLDSILSQTYPHLEIVLVNDGSTDNSLAVAENYASRDVRIRIIDKPNEGVAATRNVGLNHATGDFVLFVDSDDWIELDMVGFLVKQADETGCSIVICNSVKNNEPVKKEYSVRQVEQREVIELFLAHRELSGSLWNKLFDRNLLLGLQFDPEVSYGEDALFCWQVFQRYTGCCLLSDRQLYHYRMNDASISHSFGKLKFTAHKVWSVITNDTANLFPDLLLKAQAEFCNQMTIILFDAAKNSYPNDNMVKKLCVVVREYRHVLFKEQKCSLRKRVAATLLSVNYILAKLVFSSVFRMNNRLI